MDVCRMRQTPIMTFVNKLDREGLPPLEVMADIEAHLGIECVPLTWPVGMGKEFKGTYDLRTGMLRPSLTHGAGCKSRKLLLTGWTTRNWTSAQETWQITCAWTLPCWKRQAPPLMWSAT